MVKAGLTAQNRSLRQVLWVHSWGNLSLSLCSCAEKAQRDWQLWVKALMSPFLGAIVRYSVVTWGRFSECFGGWKPYSALCAGGAHSWGCSQSLTLLPSSSLEVWQACSCCLSWCTSLCAAAGSVNPKLTPLVPIWSLLILWLFSSQVPQLSDSCTWAKSMLGWVAFV